VRLESEQFATFAPADPPRAGALAVWGDGQGPDELLLVLPAGGDVRRRRVRGRLLPLAAALTGRVDGVARQLVPAGLPGDEVQVAAHVEAPVAVGQGLATPALASSWRSA
jgi:hypothetical protein